MRTRAHDPRHARRGDPGEIAGRPSLVGACLVGACLVASSLLGCGGPHAPVAARDAREAPLRPTSGTALAIGDPTPGRGLEPRGERARGLDRSETARHVGRDPGGTPDVDCSREAKVCTAKGFDYDKVSPAMPEINARAAAAADLGGVAHR